MSHELDFTNGNAAIAYKASNGTPWHGLGNFLDANMSPMEAAIAAGVDFTVRKAPLVYMVPEMGEKAAPNRSVLYRDDTGDFLSTMSTNSYKPAQPIEVIEGLFEVIKGSGYELDVIGALKGGRIIWALAKRLSDPGTIGNDIIKPYLSIKTSYDGTIARSASMTSIREVCWNTLSYSYATEKSAKQRNSSEFTLDKANDLFDQLGQFDAAFDQYMETLRAMTKVKMTDNKLGRFFTKLYAPDVFEKPDNWTNSPMDWENDKISTNQKNVIAALLDTAKDNPGWNLPSADGTLFGALQTVTYYQDHMARTKGNKRFESAFIGQGARIKNDALELAQSLI